jgi:phosphatidate cytidylyltransferase
MILTRLRTALVGIPILLAITLISEVIFALALLVVLLLAGWEYVHLLRQEDSSTPQLLIWALVVLPVAATWFDHEDWLAPDLIGLLIIGAFYAVVRMEQGSDKPVHELALAVFGGVYIGWLGSTLLAVRLLDDGAHLIIVIYTCVAVTDTAAYFAGRQWGKRKLAPRVSPNKTWEGYIGSAITGPVIGGLMGVWLLDGTLTWQESALMGTLIGVLGTVGDLAISVIKREVGAKDTGHWFPGHGGVLDRIDSVLVATALSYYFLIEIALR